MKLLLIQTGYHCEECRDSGELPNGNTCGECCDHSDMEDFTCLDCGSERTEWFMAGAYDSAKASRQG